MTTERELGRPAAGGTSHDIHFNRGVAGSQAYVRKFGKVAPQPELPDSEQMKWLSRGLYEALTGFIGLAAGEDAADYGLRAMLYEFEYPGVGEAFADAADAGADIDIRYEAQSYKDQNEGMIRVGLGVRELAAKDEVTPSTVQRFESGRGDMHSRTLDRVQQVLEEAGVIFIGADAEGGAGVRMKA